LESKTLVAGGASRGLGRAAARSCCRELVAEGARVLLVARDGDALDKVAKEDLGERANPLAASLAEPGGVSSLSQGRARRSSVGSAAF